MFGTGRSLWAYFGRQVRESLIQPPRFLLQQLVKFRREYHHPAGVLFKCNLFAEFQPALFLCALHQARLTNLASEVCAVGYIAVSWPGQFAVAMNYLLDKSLDEMTFRLNRRKNANLFWMPCVI